MICYTNVDQAWSDKQLGSILIEYMNKFYGELSLNNSFALSETVSFELSATVSFALSATVSLHYQLLFRLHYQLMFLCIISYCFVCIFSYFLCQQKCSLYFININFTLSYQLISYFQGTVTPTHYVVIKDTSKFSPDIVQKIRYLWIGGGDQSLENVIILIFLSLFALFYSFPLKILNQYYLYSFLFCFMKYHTFIYTKLYYFPSYKLTHMYFNWPGTIRVPAPCQYAHKLAYQVC